MDLMWRANMTRWRPNYLTVVESAHDSVIENSELTTLLHYAKKFFTRLRGPASLNEFRLYLNNLAEDVSALGDQGAVVRISAQIVEVRRCDYVLRNTQK